MNKLLAIFAACAVICVAPANAHSGANILTAGGAKERTSMTAGMQFQEIAGVHVYRGSSALAGSEPPTPDLAGARRRVEIEIRQTGPFRRIRHMRTQGFYSGQGYSSKQFTQGFYSGQ